MPNNYIECDGCGESFDLDELVNGATCWNCWQAADNAPAVDEYMLNLRKKGWWG